MRRRRGKLGESLAVDDYTGFVTYRSRLRPDEDNFYSERPLKRNLQEIASPLNDPKPVDRVGAAANYETYDVCDLQVAPVYVGRTSVRTSTLSAAMQSQAYGIDPGIGDMEVGCSFRVY